MPARSSSLSSQAISALEVAASGRRAPRGGMAPTRSLRTTFSHASASRLGLAMSSSSIASSPVFSLAVVTGDAVPL